MSSCIFGRVEFWTPRHGSRQIIIERQGRTVMRQPGKHVVSLQICQYDEYMNIYIYTYIIYKYGYMNICIY